MLELLGYSVKPQMGLRTAHELLPLLALFHPIPSSRYPHAVLESARIELPRLTCRFLTTATRHSRASGEPANERVALANHLSPAMREEIERCSLSLSLSGCPIVARIGAPSGSEFNQVQ